MNIKPRFMFVCVDGAELGKTWTECWKADITVRSELVLRVTVFFVTWFTLTARVCHLGIENEILSNIYLL